MLGGGTSPGKVSWVYPESRQQVPAGVAVHPKPMHYHDLLATKARSRRDPRPCSGRSRLAEVWRIQGSVADELNVDVLVGAKSVKEVLKIYELETGFYHDKSDSDSSADESRSLSREITEEDIAEGKRRWSDMVKFLTEGGHSSRSPSRTEGKHIENLDFLSLSCLIANPLSDLRSPTSTTSDSIDLTDSEHSVDSDPVPPTPKAREANFWDSGKISVSHPSPYSDFSSRVLNASALSFTPTSSTPAKMPSIRYPHSFEMSPSPSPAPVYTDFTFPSLNPNPSVQPLCLKKDEQGFYTEVKSSSGALNSRTAPRSSSNSILPPHNLRARKASRTREIVDQMRSASVNNFDGDNRPLSRGTVPPRPVSTPHQMLLTGNFFGSKDSADALEPSGSQPPMSPGLAAAVVDLEDESDGWVRSSKGGRVTKAQRTKELVQALGRKRSDSNTQESESDPNHPEEGGDWELAPASISSTAVKNTSSSTSATSTPTRRKGSRHRSRKSQGRSTSSSTSAGVTPAPPMPPPPMLAAPPQPFFHPAARYPVYPTPYPYVGAPPMIAFKPMPGPMPPIPQWYPAYRSPPFGVPMPLQPGIPVHGSITGGSGMRHAQW